MRLSVIVCLDILCQSIYCAIALFKVFESQLATDKISEAQLRLVPNRPCMTLVLHVAIFNPRSALRIGGGLLQSFGDFCPSVRRNPLLLNGKGRHREVNSCPVEY